MFCSLFLIGVPLFTARFETPTDPRDAYDVETYRLDLAVDPVDKVLAGEVGVELLIVAESVDAIALDLAATFQVREVRELQGALTPTGPWTGTQLTFVHEKRKLVCALSSPRKQGERVRLVVAYSGKPKARNDFDGFHWSKTKDGRPWISTSCQGAGSASWWPSKDSFDNPEDKPARVFLNYTVPKGLYAVGNGRLMSRSVNEDDTETFHWVHEYPLETYSVTLDVAPYVVVETELTVAGNETKIPFVYYVLAENAEKAALQFQDVPEMLAIYSRAFGAFPFPRSKFALVETSFWGMEHSTAVAYGSSYPAWIAKHGGKDPHASRNARFDYILVHESAHEWWGNGVSAKAWGDFWIHEGFATYAEAVYLEFLKGPEVARAHMQSWRSNVGREARLYRGDDVDSNQAYSITIYSKGAWVLHTLRHYVDDDESFWRAIRAFNLEYRYANASSQDFRAVLERETKRDWKTFFDEWVYGAGYPVLDGVVRATDTGIAIDVSNEGTAKDGFHVPVDITWNEGEKPMKRRVELAPGKNEIAIACPMKPTNLTVAGLDHVLCQNRVRTE